MKSFKDDKDPLCRMRLRLFFLLFQWFFLSNSFAQSPFAEFENLFTTPKSYTVYQVNDRLNLDGRPLEKSWQNAPWSDYFVDIEGNVKPTPRHKTRVKMLWDQKALYVYAELEEPDLWATLKVRDQIVYRDNDFEVFIDPDGDTHNYFEIEVNALATILDLFMSRPYRNSSRPLISWNADSLKMGLHLDGTLNDPNDQDNTWSVEMAIPFQNISLGKQANIPTDGDIWRINFSRVQWDLEVQENGYQKKRDPNTNRYLPEHNWVWSPQGVINMHFPERWGYIQFTQTKAGQPKPTFRLPETEEFKKYLWLVYYKQAQYMRIHGCYAPDWKTLNLDSLDQKDFSLKLETNKQQYFATLVTEENQGWQINHQGRIEEVKMNKSYQDE